MNYIPVKKTFKSKGFEYKQIKRDGDVAIYEQISKDGAVAYETVIIARHNGYTIGTSRVEPSETYPSSGMWGVNGFTYNDIESAEKRAELLQLRIIDAKQKKTKEKVDIKDIDNNIMS